jgi:hypothetical protein
MELQSGLANVSAKLYHEALGSKVAAVREEVNDIARIAK